MKPQIHNTSMPFGCHVSMTKQVHKVIENWSFGLAYLNDWTMKMRSVTIFPIAFSFHNSQMSFTIKDTSNISFLSLCKFYFWFLWRSIFFEAMKVIYSLNMANVLSLTFRRASFGTVFRPKWSKSFVANYTYARLNPFFNIRRHSWDYNNARVEMQAFSMGAF